MKKSKCPAMNYISTGREPLSELDSDCGRGNTRRHPYNTRSSGNIANLRNPSPKRAHKRTNKCSPVRKQYFDEYKDSPSMDYCFDDACIPQPRCPKFKPSWFARASQFISCIGVFIMAYLVYTQFYLMHDVKDLQEQFHKMRGVHKKEDPHAKLSKELDKKCSNTLKLLLKDPVGRPDFALASSGGRIVSVDAIPFTNPVTFLGIKICEGQHSPSEMIQATTAPGECWAFKGYTGKAVVELIDDVIIDSVTLEHIAPTISPSGSIDTAPKDFKIWGLDGPNGGRTFLGQFRYENDGTTLQTFNINNDSTHYRFVEFEVLSNHGSDKHTCVYRLRVHGTTKKAVYKN